MEITTEHLQVAKALEQKLLESKANNTVISMDEFYEMSGRERFTNKFYQGVQAAGESRHLLIAFGDHVVAVTRDVAT